MEIFLHVFGAEGAAKNFLSTFFEIFVKFVNKNAIKSDFWGDCVEVSRKFSKNPRFWQKSISTLGRNFEKYFYRGALTPPPNNSLIANWPRGSDL